MITPLAFLRNRKIKRVARRLGAEFVDLKNKPEIALSLGSQATRLKAFAREKKSALSPIRELVAIAYEISPTSEEAISKMYDAVYGEDNGPHYQYSSALLSRVGFEYIVGLGVREESKIIDIGAGDGVLLQFLHDEFKVSKENLYGSDISRASKDIIDQKGFHGACGRIENLHFPQNNFDFVFLSYFIDYDTNQEATFREAVKIVKPGGKIILEGLFPCRQFGMLEHSKERHVFITKGGSAGEDIGLVCDAFQNFTKEEGKKIVFEKIIAGWRHLYSHDGLDKLPSYFIVMRVE